MIGRFLKQRKSNLEGLDPQRIYIENVRYFLCIRESWARWLCEKAVRDGLFEKWTGFEHPEHGHFITELRDGDDIPQESVLDEISEGLEDEKTEFYLDELRKIHFYKAPIREIDE